MLSTNLLLVISAAAACRAAGLTYPHDLYARQDAMEGDSVTVSTLTPESVETSIMEGSTTDVPISGTTSTWTLGTDASEASTVSITSTNVADHTSGSETISSVFGTSSIEITLDSGSESSVSLPTISTTVILPEISTKVSISALQTVVSLEDIVTVLSIPDDSTVVTFEGVTTTIAISGTSSDVTVKGPSTEVSIAAVSSDVSIGSTESVVSFDSTTLSTSNSGQSIHLLIPYPIRHHRRFN